MPAVRTDGWVYGHMITKISRMGRSPHFLTHGAALRKLRARDLRYYVVQGILGYFPPLEILNNLGCLGFIQVLFYLTQKFLHFGINQQLLHFSKVSLHIFKVILSCFAFRMGTN